MTITAAAEGAYTPFTTTLTFEWTTPPLSLNYRLSKHAEARIIRDVREVAAYKAGRLPDLGRCQVELTWFVTDKRVRDVENPVPTLKALCDGLVDAGVVRDDRPAYMTKLMPAIVWVDKKAGNVAHFELRIDRLPV